MEKRLGIWPQLNVNDCKIKKQKFLIYKAEEERRKLWEVEGTQLITYLESIHHYLYTVC